MEVRRIRVLAAGLLAIAVSALVGKGVGTKGIGGTVHASKIEVASKSAR
jgi:hypothetical protein